MIKDNVLSKTSKGLIGASAAFGIASRCVDKKCHVVVCGKNSDAEKIAMDLNSFKEGLSIYFPDTETLAYDHESPHASLRGLRAQAVFDLLNLPANERRFLVVSVENLAKKISPKSFWEDNFRRFSSNQKLSISDAVEFLEHTGYEKEKLDVSNPGEYAVHNEVLDVFPVNQEEPVRLYFDDNKLIEIFKISVEDQRNTDFIDSVLIAPGYELPIDEKSLRKVRSFIRTHENFSDKDPVFTSINEGEIPFGIEFFIPEIHEPTLITSMIDDQKKGGLIFVNTDEGTCDYFERVKYRYNEIIQDGKRVVPEPNQIWATPSEIFNDRSAIYLSTDFNEDSPVKDNGVVRQPDLQSTMDMLTETLERSSRVVISVGADSRVKELKTITEMMGVETKVIQDFSHPFDMNEQFLILRKPVSGGFLIEDSICIVSEKELFGNKSNDGQQRWTTKTADFTRIQDLETLQIGDPLVHLEYGVGRYAGLETINMGTRDEEMLKIRYAEDATAFVSMDELYLVTRHGGLTEEKVPLDIMQSKKWQKSLKHAVQEIRRTANELIKIKNERQSIKGIACRKPTWKYHRFSNGFPFDTTPDQSTAIDSVLNDLMQTNPMDRLVVGDVGFGKTEVAMRGAFHAADNGYHVMIVAPTKVLAYQHYQTFKQRFEGFDPEVVFIEGSTPSEKRRAEKMLAGSKPVVMVGTHTLLRITNFAEKIGLLVIDEEHRFGTADKHLMAGLHGQINVLNMTATPIPRTLSLSLNGIRDISIIATPPSRRLSIRTMVSEPDVKIYREAIEREKMRGGQVYVLHNDIDNLPSRMDFIKTIDPTLTVELLHGRMSSSEQTDVLTRFTRQEIDVLICTTIIETGIDIPTANTILIEKPDRIGLSQLHQLRGRVGRSHHQAYCYLIEKEENIGTVARKRFDALIKAKNLGDGFLLANHDLEIRGAGELLGEKQSGEIHKIGFTLYSKLLRRAISMIEEGSDLYKLLDREMKVELSLAESGLIESSYIESGPLRLAFYKRLSSADTLAEVDLVQKDMGQRFGPIPEKTRILCLISKIRVYARRLGLSKILAEETRGYVETRHKDFKNDLEEAMHEVTFEVTPKSRGFEFYAPMSKTESRFVTLVQIMQAFSTRLSD